MEMEGIQFECLFFVLKIVDFFNGIPFPPRAVRDIANLQPKDYEIT
ncbi:MAG: hypothetical protein K0S23_3389 [Fluviicola sp.]|jgi:hypothetical protein|nr:hypothetical protein [Fluviicola sp.]